MFDLWLPEAKRPSSSSRVCDTPRAPATQRCLHAHSTAQNRRRDQQVALLRDTMKVIQGWHGLVHVGVPLPGTPRPI
jgi:hypothetical protein